MIKGSPVSFSSLINMPNVKGANIVNLEDSEKNGNPWKIFFYPKGYFSEYLVFSTSVTTVIYPKYSLANSTFLGVKDTQICPEKTKGQPFKRLKFITKTCLYNFDPLKPHFHTVNWGLEGYTIFFSYFCSNHRLWVLVRTASARRV